MRQLTLQLSDGEMEALEREAHSNDQSVEDYVREWIQDLATDPDFEAEFGGFRPQPEDIVNDTFASNPGHVQVQWTRFYRAYPTIPILFTALFALIGWLSFSKSLWWSLPLMLLVPLLLRLIGRTRSQFRAGDTNPALLISHNPPLIAAMTDLSKGPGEYPVIKILPQPLKVCGLANAPVGTRLVACSLYGYTLPEAPHWSTFHPVIVQAATNDPDVHEAKLQSIPPHDWRQLESALDQLSDRLPGTYPIGWQAEKGALNQD